MEYNSGSNRAKNFNRFEITSPITPELYDTKSYYQLIVPITKCENLSLGIFTNVRNRFQSKKVTGFNFGCGNPTAWWSFFQKSIFLIKIHVRQYLNKMREFLKVMELKYSLSRQLTGRLKLHDKFYILTSLIYYVTRVKIFQQVLYILLQVLIVYYNVYTKTKMFYS